MEQPIFWSQKWIFFKPKYLQYTKEKYIRDGPLENLWGGGWSTKKKFAQGKIKRKKILARQLTLKNIHAMA